MRDSFGDWLRNKIKESGKTQKEFADMIGIEQPHLSRILSGTRGASNETLNRIATALCIPEKLIFEKAGALHPTSDYNARLTEATYILSMLEEEDIDEIIQIARMKLERKKASPTRTSRKVKPPAQTVLNGQ